MVRTTKKPITIPPAVSTNFAMVPVLVVPAALLLLAAISVDGSVPPKALRMKSMLVDSQQSKSKLIRFKLLRC